MRPILILLIIALAACSRPPPEEQLLAVIDDIELMLEARRPGDALDFVAEDFSGNGYLDKRQLHSFLVQLFFRHKQVEIIVTDLGIVADTTDDSRFYMEASAILLGGKNIAPDSARAYRLRGLWRRDDGDWLLVSLAWE